MNMMIILMMVMMITIKNANQCCRLLGNFCGETFIENSHSAYVIISLKDGSCGVDLSARKHRKLAKVLMMVIIIILIVDNQDFCQIV